MDVKTNVVIICYNALSYTKATVESLFNKTYSPFNLTIINNGSNHNTRVFLEQLKLSKNCKKYTLIKNNANRGVGHAYNQGFQLSLKDNVKYTCFCNNDLYFSDNWLAKLEKCLDDNQAIAMLNPLRPSAKTIYSPGLSTLARLMQINKTFDYKSELENFTSMPIEKFDLFCEKIIQNNRQSLKDDIEILEFPDSLSTCVCLINNSHFKKLGNFADPIFKKYGSEDIDTSWRVMKLGYQCAISKNVYVHHFRGKSLSDNNLNRRELLKVANKLLYKKWRSEINSFLQNQETRGIDIAGMFAVNTGNTGNQYWLLSQLNNDADLLKGLCNERRIGV